MRGVTMARNTALRRSLAAGALSLALFSAALLPTSCGKGTDQGGEAGGGPSEVVVEIRKAEDIDELIRDIDESMNELNDEDFAPDQLNEGKLGW